MDPKERLKKAFELIDDFEALKIESSMDQIDVLKLFVQSLFPDLTIKRNQID